MNQVYLFSTICAFSALLLLFLLQRITNKRHLVSAEVALLDPLDLLIHPQPANYCGASSHYGRIKCNGQIYLTRKRLVFHPYFGSTIALELSAIISAELRKSFLGGLRLGSQVLVLTLANGIEIGFYCRDPELWSQTLRESFPT